MSSGSAQMHKPQFLWPCGAKHAKARDPLVPDHMNTVYTAVYQGSKRQGGKGLAGSVCKHH